MRITAKTVNAIIAETKAVTNGAFNANHGAGYNGTGDKWTLVTKTKALGMGGLLAWLSASGENRQAAAYFCGVISAYRGEVPNDVHTDSAYTVYSNLAGNTVFDEWFAKGADHGARAKEVSENEKKRAAEADKETMRNDARPIEERRAAFRSHNRRGNPFYVDAEAASTVLRAAGHTDFEATVRDGLVVVFHLADGQHVKSAGELLDYAATLEAAGWTGPGEHVIPMVQSATATDTTRVEAVPPNDPTPRRVESSSQDLTDETGYNGTNWPTHTVDVWLQNDSKVLEDATNHARMGDDSLRDYVEALLFNVRSLPKVALARLTETDAHGFDNVDNVRDSLAREIDGNTPRQAFDRIDWTYVRTSLLGL